MRRTAAILSTLILAMTPGCRTARGVSVGPAETRTGLVLLEQPATRLHRAEPGLGQDGGMSVQLVSHQDTDTAEQDEPEDNVESDKPDIPPPAQTTPANDAPPTDTTPALTLDDFHNLALQNSPIIQHSTARVEAARGQHLQAGLYPNPTIGYHGMNIGSRGTAGRQAGFVQQRFVTGGKLQLDREIASTEVRNQQALLIASQHRVITDVRSRFYVALLAQRRKELAEELLQVVNELGKSTKKLLETGQASENVLLQAEIEVEQTHIIRDNADNELREAWRQLCVVAGSPNLPLARLAGDFESAFLQQEADLLAAQLVESHPLVVAARTRVDRAAAAITRAQREVIPDLQLTVDAARTNQTISNTAQARLGVEVPLWDKNQGNIRSAEADLAAAKTEQRRIELQLQQQLATVLRQYSNALHQSNRYRDSILPRAKRSLALVRKGYDNGQVEYLTLLNSQQKFVQVNLSYTDSLRGLQEAAALLDGKLLTNSLAPD